jgi:ketosteroid isomerase-like protein
MRLTLPGSVDDVPSRREIVEIAYAAFESGELEPLLRHVSDDIELSPIVGMVTGSTYRGTDGLRAWRADLAGAFDEFWNEGVEMREVGDRVLVRSRFCARGRGSGVSTEQPAIAVFDFDEDRIARYAAHVRPDEKFLAELGWPPG